MNNNIEISNKHIVEYITDMLNTFKCEKTVIRKFRYHHTTKYKDAPSVCEKGVLTLRELNELGLRNDSQELLKIMNDTNSHINGIDGISLAVVGLKDLSRNEFEYNPYNPTVVDFIISSDIKARRSASHYGNEFISDRSIPLDKIVSVDLRILELIKESQELGLKLPNTDLVEKYNYMIDMAIALQNNGYDIPLREMSGIDTFTIDTDKASTASKILIKKR